MFQVREGEKTRERERTDEYFFHIIKIENNRKIIGKVMRKGGINWHYLKYFTPKFNYVVCLVGESNYLDKIIMY